MRLVGTNAFLLILLMTATQQVNADIFSKIFGEKMPEKEDIQETFLSELSNYLSLKEFEILASKNIGDDVDPLWRSRFHSTIKPKNDLFDEDYKEKDQVFIKMITPMVREIEVFGHINSSLYQGKWQHRFVLEGSPLENLGVPISSFSPKAIISNSTEENNFYSEKNTSPPDPDVVKVLKRYNLNEKAIYNFIYKYLKSSQPRAFAVSPKGSWAWKKSNSEETSKKEALDRCQQYSSGECTLIHVNYGWSNASDYPQNLKEREKKATQLILKHVASIESKITRSRLIKRYYKTRNLNASVSIEVNPKGEVIRASIKRSSGDEDFDQSVMRAIKKASPLPIPYDPILFEFYKEINITFN